MSGHACNARCDGGGHYLLDMGPGKHRRTNCLVTGVRNRRHCDACEDGAIGAAPGYQPRHRAEVTRVTRFVFVAALTLATIPAAWAITAVWGWVDRRLDALDLDGLDEQARS